MLEVSKRPFICLDSGCENAKWWLLSWEDEMPFFSVFTVICGWCVLIDRLCGFAGTSLIYLLSSDNFIAVIATKKHRNIKLN